MVLEWFAMYEITGTGSSCRTPRGLENLLRSNVDIMFALLFSGLGPTRVEA